MIRLFAIFFCLVFSAAGLELPPPTVGGQSLGETNRPQYNFLFVIDTSLSMASRKPAAIKLLREVIASGFNGQIEPGDSIDIWTFDGENHIARFPPHLWEHEEKHRIAAIAARFLEQQKFKGRSHFLPVAADLESLLPHAKNLLTVIITDAEPPVAGIHLDLEINEYVAKEKKLRPGSKNPLLISLAANSGKFHEWTVFNGEGELDLATLPSRPKPLPIIVQVLPQKMAEPEPVKEPEPAPVVINYPPGTRITPIAPPKLEPEVAEPKAETPILALEPAKTAVDETRPDETSAALAAVTPPAPPPPNLKKISEKEVPSAPVEIAKPIVESPLIAPVEKNLEQSALASKKTSAPVVASSQTLRAPPKSSPTKAAPATPTQPTIALTTPTVPTTTIYIAVTAGLAFLAMGVFLVLRRHRSRHESSIISKSLLQ